MSLAHHTSSVTHAHRPKSLEQRVEEIRARLISQGDQPHGSVAEALSLLSELTTFELGQHLLIYGALSGPWTKYCVADVALGRMAQTSSALEHTILTKLPVMRATQERFMIFRKQIQQRLRADMVLADVPCGTMDALFSLDYSGCSGVALYGLDIDAHSIALGQKNAVHYPQAPTPQLHVADAWQLDAWHERFDLITSNGLNIYVADQQREQKLYEQFAAALKLGGVLVTSFLTPPPTLVGDASPWQNVDPEAARLQRLLMVDIIGAKWQCFRTADEMRQMMSNAGLNVKEIINDSQGIFPTLIATRASDRC